MMGDISSERRRSVLVVCPFPQDVAAGQRLKYEQYFKDWHAGGYNIDVTSFMDRAVWAVVYRKGHYGEKIRGVLCGHIRRLRDLFRIRRYDIVYVFMWVTPFGTSLFERLTRFLARRLIFDVEDNVMIDSTLNRNDNPNHIVRIFKGPGKAQFLIRRADHVITSSPFLNDLCMQMNERKACTYISASVDTDRFVPVNSYTNDQLVTVGWTGTFSSKVYLDMIREVLQELARRVPYRLKIIGNFDYELEGVDIEVVQWTKEREVEDLQTLDIGIYPLPINDWVLGKSGLKAIQYMAFGLPTVATAVGTTPMLIKHGVSGLLVRTDSDWLEALEMLIRDPALRRRLGKEARRAVVANYSIEAIASQYRQVLEDVWRLRI